MMTMCSSKSACNNPRAGTMARHRLYVAVLLALSGTAHALPQGGEVVAGDASIAVSGETMDIQQNSQRAILNFQSFDINGQQTVTFHQPGADAVALSRVLGGNLSEIHGALNANGQVYLINPGGVLFGNGAQVNVGSLLVSTLDISDQDFLTGRDSFAGGDTGTVENNGSIQAASRVVLLAPEVINRGDITVPGGDITLRAGRQALLHTPGSDIPILLDDSEFIGQVINEGNLQAGAVALVLDGASQADMLDAAVNNSGLVRAVRASGEGGAIELLAPGGDLVNSGILDASAVSGSGGSLTLHAEHIDQSGVIAAAAVGAGDGGEINLYAEDAIAMHSGSTISADAGNSGDGGGVVVIAERATWFTSDSTITARGGELAGDGGFVEVSGHEFVSVSGNVDVGAAAGEGGLWYIDPTDITISNMDSGGVWMGGNWVLTGSPTSSMVNVTSILNALNNGNNVTINTASGAASAGNITFAANTTLNIDGLGAVRTLTLQANGSIIFNNESHISDSNFATANGLNVIATAGTGILMSNRSTILSGTGKINISTTSGDATIVGLGSSANTADAIRVTASAGRIINGGDDYLNLISNGTNGGVILSGSSGITDLSLDASYVDAVSSGGNVSLFAGDLVNVSRLSSASSASIHSNGEVLLNSATVLGGNNIQISSSLFVAVPLSGLTAPGTLTLLGPDIVSENAGIYGRTLTLGADNLVINTNAAGGNLQINSNVNSLSLTNDFSNSITVTEANAVTLGTVAPQSGNISVSSGAGTDLTIGTNIDLTGMAGSLTLGAGRNLLLNASILDTDGPSVSLTAPNSVIFAAASEVSAGTGSINITATSGDVALGRLTGGSLTVTAGGAITDANGASLNLSGTSASLTAGTAIGTLADSLEGTLGSLNLTASGGGAFFSNSQALTLSSLNINGNLNVSLPTAGNLTLSQSNPIIGGSATFSAAAGQLVVPNVFGWSTSGNLTVTAQGIVDSDATVTLAAAGADLSLGGAASVLNVDFNTLALQVLSGQQVQVADLDDLTLSNLSSTGNLLISTGGNSNLTLTDTTPSAGAQLTLTAGGDLVLPTTGFSITGNLTILADNLRDSDTTISLGGAGANIILSDGAAAQTWTTSFNDLVLSIAGAGALSLTDINGLTLTSATTGGSASYSATGANLVLTSVPTAGGDLTLGTIGSGNVVIPNAGLVRSGNLTVLADNLVDSDNNLTLGAAAANITLRDGAAARTWTTGFDSLALAITGGGAFSLTDSNGLTLTSASTGGNASFTTTNANLVLSAAPSIAGALALSTSGTGDVVIPNAGLIHAGNLTVLADDLRDSDSTLTLGATSANINLRGGALAQTWSTSFDSLVLAITGTGAFSLTDSNGLTLTSATTGGNASFTTTSANLVLAAAPSVAGTLALNTAGSGDVVMPNAGLLHAGNLTVLADNLRDSDTTLTLGATAANINLRGGDSAQTWNTSFSSLVLAITGGGAFTLTDANGLTLTSASTGGNASYSTAGANLVLAAVPAAGGSLSLGTSGSGDVVIPDTGLVHAGNFTVVADNLVDSNHNLTLGAANANITLRDGAAARTWTTGFANLVLSIAGAGTFNLTDSNSLTLTSASTGGSASFSATNGDLVLASMPTVNGALTLATVGSGDLVIPAAGLVHNGNLTVTADDLSDGDSTFTLGATNAIFNLRGGAAAQTWSTSFQTLALSLAGTGAFSLTDVDGLTLGSVSSGGSASFTATGANLVLQNSPTVAGDLSLTTSGSGALVIPDTGLNHSGALILSADQITDFDNAINLAATDLTATLRDQQVATNWTTSLNNLSLNLAGGGNLNSADTGDLTVSSLVSDGAVDLSSTGDLNLSSVTLGGDLALTTAPNGTLTTGIAGLTLPGDLSVDAGRLSGSGRWNANQISVRLRDTVAPTSLDLDAASISLTNDSVASLSLQLADGARLDSLASGGDVQVDGAGSLVLGADTYAVAGQMAFDLSGDLTLMASGLNFTGSLQVTASNLLAAGGGPVTLAGSAADLLLTGSQALDLSTRLSQLGVTYAAAGPFNLSSDRTLTLTRFDAPAVGELSLTVNGTLTLPFSGLAAQQRLTLDAVDLLDGDRTLALAAPQVAVRLSNAIADSTWNLTAGELDVLMRGAASLAVNDAGGLMLADLNNDGQAVSVENGNFVLSLSSGDLLVGADLNAADLTDDNLRTGLIDLGVAAGNLVLQSGAEIVSSNNLDQEAAGVADAYGIRLRLLDTSTADRSITLNEDARLQAVGGDILIDTRPATASGGRRQFVQASGSLIDAYNNPGDAITGVVLLNGEPVTPAAGQTVRAGRVLSIVTDAAPPNLGNPLDQIDDLDDVVKVVEEVETSGPKASAQYEQVFGICDELDQKNRHRCRVDGALKAFLSHWLVGGEMPPKTENP
jgi:filamentous hemagglutinin family protein